jgi:hypothetical protein
MNDVLVEIYLGEGAAKSPKKKTTFMCNEEDFNLLREVFPESGFITYAPGKLINLLANECRKRNINSVTDRNGTSLESISRVLSSIQLVGDDPR